MLRIKSVVIALVALLAIALASCTLDVPWPTVGDATVEPPEIMPMSGYVTWQSKATITAEAGAVIYYTMNRTDPTTASKQYTEPIVVKKNVEIRAIAVKDDVSSPVVSASYLMLDAPYKQLSGISISGYTTEYEVGDTFVFDGTVTAHYTNGIIEPEDVTEMASVGSISDMTRAAEGVNIDINYTEGHVTATEIITINIRAKK